MKILALAGSLRAASINAALLRAAARLAPPGCTITLLSLAALPLFNPDLEGAPAPAVLALRRAVDLSDALMIASPEYAHGVSGVMKNALDWLVSHEGFVAKPVALLNSSPRAHHAYEALAETLGTMSAHIVREACVAIPLLGAGLDEEGMVGNAAVATSTRARRALRRLRGRLRRAAGSLRPAGTARGERHAFFRHRDACGGGVGAGLEQLPRRDRDAAVSRRAHRLAGERAVALGRRRPHAGELLRPQHRASPGGRCRRRHRLDHGPVPGALPPAGGAARPHPRMHLVLGSASEAPRSAFTLPPPRP
jgi:NAD(P)H-dependent FMN reductase